MATSQKINIKIELSGGLELIFGNQKQFDIELTAAEGETTVPITQLLEHMKETILVERPELFLQNNTVRPGIIVMINDADWELEGGDEASLSDGDTVSFISTLHGG